jgi:hypothetical protein
MYLSLYVLIAWCIYMSCVDLSSIIDKVRLGVGIYGLVVACFGYTYCFDETCPSMYILSLDMSIVTPMVG